MKAEKTAEDYSAMQRDFYNQRARTLQDAKDLVHLDYDYAAAQAPAFILFALTAYYSLRRSTVPSPVVEALALQTSMLRARMVPLVTEKNPARRFVLRAARFLRRRAIDYTQRALTGPVATSAMPTALDFGCGVGRLMKPYVVAGGRVDGVDISREMLQFAKAEPLLAGSKFFESSGSDCGDAGSATYDLVFSAICIQHIASRTVRKRILKDIRRVLREGGVVVMQFHYYPEITDAEIPPPHVPWSADAFDAPGTNSEADVWITPESIRHLLEDVRAEFSDPALSFCEFPDDAKLFRGAYGHFKFEHLIVTASAGRTRVDSLYAI